MRKGHTPSVVLRLGRRVCQACRLRMQVWRMQAGDVQRLFARFTGQVSELSCRFSSTLYQRPRNGRWRGREESRCKARLKIHRAWRSLMTSTELVSLSQMLYWPRSNLILRLDHSKWFTILQTENHLFKQTWCDSLIGVRLLTTTIWLMILTMLWSTILSSP